MLPYFWGFSTQDYDVIELFILMVSPAFCDVFVFTHLSLLFFLTPDVAVLARFGIWTF